jgi:hypothetical protein
MYVHFVCVCGVCLCLYQCMLAISMNKTKKTDALAHAEETFCLVGVQCNACYAGNLCTKFISIHIYRHAQRGGHDLVGLVVP